MKLTPVSSPSILTQTQDGVPELSVTPGRFGMAEKDDVMAAAFVTGGWLVTGTRGGRLLQWDASRRRGAMGRCVRVGVPVTPEQFAACTPTA